MAPSMRTHRAFRAATAAAGVFVFALSFAFSLTFTFTFALGAYVAILAEGGVVAGVDDTVAVVVGFEVAALVGMPLPLQSSLTPLAMSSASCSPLPLQSMNTPKVNGAQYRSASVPVPSRSFEELHSRSQLCSPTDVARTLVPVGSPSGSTAAGSVHSRPTLTLSGFYIKIRYD